MCLSLRLSACPSVRLSCFVCLFVFRVSIYVSLCLSLAALAAPPLLVGCTGGALFVTLRIQSQ